MPEAELAYGRRSISFVFDESRFSVLAPGDGDRQLLSDVEINTAIDTPIESPNLEEIVGPGQSVLIVVSDAARATASGQIVNLLVRRLIAAGVAPSDINIIFATGIHRAPTAEEKRDLLTPFIFQRIKTIDHNAYDRSMLVHYGETERGTPVELNRALKEHTHVFLTGGVGFHYFAGFTGGRKSICPGLASARTITATHMLAFDFEKGGRRSGVGPGLLGGNAVHEECESIAAMVKPSFLINTIVDGAGRAVGVFAGDWRAAHRAACDTYARQHIVTIAARRDIVLASCGGSPYDINLIQAHKTLDMASQACSEGGTIVLVAECREGLGREDFMKWFAQGDPNAIAEQLRTEYEVNGQTAWALLTKAKRFRVRLISQLPAEAVRAMNMEPASTLEEALSVVPNDAMGYIMPRGATFLPVAEGFT
jgi:nickel-dependent lactate racemase